MMTNNNFKIDMGNCVAYFPKASSIINSLDEAFLSFVCDGNVVEVKTPSIISKEILERCGYFRAFPQQLTELKPYDSSENKMQYYLTPTACLHIYSMLEQECVTQTCYTTLARVYRYENGNFKDPERLWEFSVREMVFVGTPNYVLSSLNHVKERAFAFAKEMDGKSELVVANDLFFPSRSNQLIMRMQKKNKLKEELLMTLGSKSISVASFNYHQFHFSRSFNFDQRGKIVTGCIGFGLDRWGLCMNQ